MQAQLIARSFAASLIVALWANVEQTRPDDADPVAVRDAMVIRLTREIAENADQRNADLFNAIAQLGELASPAVIPDLLPFLDLRDADWATRPRRGMPTWFEFPTAEALVKIGVPSIPPMLHVLSTSDDPDKRRVALLVIRGVFNGVDAALSPRLTQVTLEETAKREQDPARRQRLLHAIRDVQQADSERRS